MTAGALERAWDLMFQRMKHPLVFWLRLVGGLAILPAIWLHSAWGIVVLCLATALVPFVVPVRVPTEGYLVRFIDGTLAWFRESSVLALFLTFLGGIGIAALIVWALWTRNTLWSIKLIAFISVWKTLFLVRVASRARRPPAAGREGPPED
jgi:hypothetical protein